MKLEKEEFKEKVDDLLFMLKALPDDTSAYDPPDEYIEEWEDVLGHIYEAESILENLMDEMEDNDEN